MTAAIRFISRASRSTPASRQRSDLAALAACDAILLVCPAQAVRELAARLAGSAPVVICAKGIEASSGLLMPEVLAEVLPGRPIAMLSGPSFAEEAIRGLPTAVSIATADHGARRRRSAGALAAGAFRPYWTHDVLGVALGGAVKNVLAIAAGVVEGRGLGHNAAAALITRGFAEMARLGQAMGAELETLTGLERLGDLVLTCHGPLSRNRSLGWPWARAPSSPITWLAAARSSKARRRRRRCWRVRRATKSRCRFAPPSMLSCIAARTSTRRSAPLLARPVAPRRTMKVGGA